MIEGLNRVQVQYLYEETTLARPLVNGLLRKRQQSQGQRRPQRTKYLWAKIVTSEEEDKTPVIEG
ncbi:MAG: hypothetical protein CMB21_06685 [Euryarchaeota archaeon]|nr:hypothetical protein [Euryarchaeota archaeon]|tara:strand:- start:473 stop:667 length:195 start_codon:yes stop_codon:yes gene_type:complete